jgi:hypothetical protein
MHLGPSSSITLLRIAGKEPNSSLRGYALVRAAGAAGAWADFSGRTLTMSAFTMGAAEVNAAKATAAKAVIALKEGIFVR